MQSIENEIDSIEAFLLSKGISQRSIKALRRGKSLPEIAALMQILRKERAELQIKYEVASTRLRAVQAKVEDLLKEANYAAPFVNFSLKFIESNLAGRIRLAFNINALEILFQNRVKVKHNKP